MRHKSKTVWSQRVLRVAAGLETPFIEMGVRAGRADLGVLSTPHF